MGYLISILVSILWLSVVGAVWNIIFYPLTIMARSAGWGLYASKSKDYRIYITALVVLIGGIIFLGSILPIPSVISSQEIDVSKAKFLALIWIIYSLVEAGTYALMAMRSKVFIGALSSLGGIWFIFTFINAQISQLQEILPYITHAVPFLMLSSAFAIVGFLTLEKHEEMPYAKSIVTPTPLAQEQTIICPYCGRSIPASSIFCPYCGQRVS